MKLLIATPTHSGQVHADYCSSTLAAVAALTAADHAVDVAIKRGSCLPRVRCELAAATLAGSYDHTLLVDSDQGFEPDAPGRLLAHGLDLVGAPVQVRNATMLNVENPRPAEDRPGLIEVDAIGTGFVLVARAVLERLTEAWGPWRLFEFVASAGGIAGEDHVFCLRARGLGFRVFADPGLPMRHHGSMVYDLTLLDAIERGYRPRPYSYRPIPPPADGGS